MDEFITACPRNCYSTCSFSVRVENNRITRILPYHSNLATPEGPCIKGLSYIERSASPKRIIHPLQRTGDNNWKEIPLQEALDIISGRLLDIRSRYGSRSLFWYRGSGKSGLINETGTAFWKHFGGVTITYGNLCWPAGLEAVRLTLGKVMHNLPWDLVNAKTIVVWGKNPAETNIHEMAFICKARTSGTKVIVIDPRRTPTADKADIVVMPRLGTDAALALAMAHVIINENLADEGFIKSNVTGFELFRKESLVTPEECEKISGIPSGEVRRLARMIAGEGPVTFIPGYGLQRYRNGGQTVRAILSLAIITGNIGKKGAGFNYANLQSYVFDAVKEPESYYPDPENDRPFRRSISMAKTGTHLLEQKNPEIKAIWVERGNPVLQAPDSASVREAFSRSEFTVVTDQFMTDTAKLADIVLPSTDIFEQSDITGSYWSPYVQFRPKILEPSGDAVPESELYYLLAIKMNLQIPEELLPPPGNENAEKWLSSRISGYTGLSLDDLRKGPVPAPGLEETAYSDLRFATPSGKIELCPERFHDLWGVTAWPSYVSPAATGESDFPLMLISPNTTSRIHSQFGNLDIIKSNSATPATEISVPDARKRGIKTGDRIVVFNGMGSVETTAKVTQRLQRGIVVMHNGIWIEEGGGCNFLTAPHETDMGFGAAFHGNRIEIRKAVEL